MPTKNKPFKASVTAERAFARALRQVARVSGHIVEAHVEGAKVRNSPEMLKALESYSKLIDPWARRQAAKMLAQVSKKNKASFTKQSRKLGRIIRESDTQLEVGLQAAYLMNEQVELIKSIPLKAAERAQRLAFEAVTNGERASEVAEELQRSGKVSESQANLIARTEVARANASFNQARAEAAGATHYIWRTAGDAAVRESHRKMNGKILEFSDPPTLEDGMVGNPGTFPNCRCYAEPIFDEEH